VTVIWEAAEPCPSGCGRRYWIGGHYHEAVRVERYGDGRRREYRVVVMNSHEPFPGDHRYCAWCWFVWESDSTHHWCRLSRRAALAQAQSIAARWE